LSRTCSAGPAALFLAPARAFWEPTTGGFAAAPDPCLYQKGGQDAFSPGIEATEAARLSPAPGPWLLENENSENVENAFPNSLKTNWLDRRIRNQFCSAALVLSLFAPSVSRAFPVAGVGCYVRYEALMVM
jgi:hypothetical protein